MIGIQFGIGSNSSPLLNWLGSHTEAGAERALSSHAL